MESADMGRKTWGYDAAGNLAEESDTVLRERGERIRYEYDGMNRLVKIDYPHSVDTEYEYGAPGAAGNTAGRVAKRTDGTGTVEYEYGKLGEVTGEAREIRRLGGGGVEPVKRAGMRYTSDYLGRMEEIGYDDGETVRYDYNYGGQIRQVTGGGRGKCLST